MESATLPLGPPTGVLVGLLAARASMAAAGKALVGIPDAVLDKRWAWGDRRTDVRYGPYALYELLEEAEVELGRAAQAPRTVGGRILGQAAAAAWSLHGLLLGLEADFDRDPVGGEWTVRQTLGHIVSSQASYGLRTAFWVEQARRGIDDLSPDAPGMPTIIEALEAEVGSAADVRRRFQAQFDVGIGLLAGLDARADLEAPALWACQRVTVRFRLQRWSSHLREHTIQVDKTAVLVGRSPTDIERCLRLGFEVYGRLEGACHGIPAEHAAALAERVAAVAEDVRGTAENVRAAADG